MAIETCGYYHELPDAPDARQLAYMEARRRHREAWWTAEREDFCARKETDPDTGKWLLDLEPR